MTDPASGVTDPPQKDGPSGRFAAFRHRPYVLYWAARLSASLGAQILTVAALWQIYTLTGDPLYPGLVGLVQFLPMLLLVLVTGTAADRFGRRLIMGLSIFLLAGSAALMVGVSVTGDLTAPIMLGILTVFGIGRAFMGPASSSLVVSLVPQKDFANAVTLNSTAWQTATILGPALGGLLLSLGEAGIVGWMRGQNMGDTANLLEGRGPEIAYIVATILLVIGAVLVLAIPQPPKAPARERPTISGMLEGFRYIWRQKIVLGAISLDLFAVLMGGVIALLPVYAQDVLHLGPSGLGWLRAAPGIGALIMAGILALIPIRDHAGRIMFFCVALFGVFTVVFGLSDVAWLSIVALVLLGAADMVSVVVRETLLQLWTPDAVRGRVNAVNSVFVSASNELGDFRAGGMASVLGGGAHGAIIAVTAGGVGAVIVAIAWAGMFPQLRKIRRLDQGVE
jgi:MFS family permease